MRALLVANAADADPGFVGERFRHHGYAFTECHRERPGEWPGLDGYDLVLLLGSDWSVYWPEVGASVAAELALVCAAHARGVPQFGICFGFQSMSAALGGTVARADRPEIGWFDVVTDTPDELAPGPWMQWHSDVVTVPPDAVEVARSDAGPQAWWLGHSFGTQFHPEATVTVVSRWSAGGADELAAAGVERDALAEATARNVLRSRADTDRLVDAFLARVAA